MVYEVTEISELKRMGLVIGSRTAAEHPERAYEAHRPAMRMELAWSEERGDLEWIRRRVRDVESYLWDPTLPERLAPRCRDLIARYHPDVRRR